MFNGTNLTLSSDVDQETCGKVTKTQEHNAQESQEFSSSPAGDHKVARYITRTNMKQN